MFTDAPANTLRTVLEEISVDASNKTDILDDAARDLSRVIEEETEKVFEESR